MLALIKSTSSLISSNTCYSGASRTITSSPSLGHLQEINKIDASINLSCKCILCVYGK